MGNGLKAALRGSKVPWSVEFTWRGAHRAAMECPVLGRAVPIPKGREISAAAPSSHLRLNPAGMGRPCWKKPSEFGNQEKKSFQAVLCVFSSSAASAHPLRCSLFSHPEHQGSPSLLHLPPLVPAPPGPGPWSTGRIQKTI